MEKAINNKTTKIVWLSHKSNWRVGLDFKD